MDYQQIKRFLTIVKYMNLSAAAEELYISQPALSLSISNLEKELGVKLFYRVRNGLMLTPTGSELLEEFRDIKDSYDRFKAKKDLLQQKKENAFITLGYSGNALFFATILLTEFFDHYKYKKESVKMVYADRLEILEMLKSGRIDFALCYPPLEDEAIGSMILRSENILLVTPTGHPLAQRGSVNLKELEAEEFIALSKQNYFRNMCDRLFAERGFKPNYVYEYDQLNYYKAIEKNKKTGKFLTFCAHDSYTSLYGDGYTCHEIADAKFIPLTSLSFISDRKLQHQHSEFIYFFKNNYNLVRSYYERISACIAQNIFSIEQD